MSRSPDGQSPLTLGEEGIVKKWQIHSFDTLASRAANAIACCGQQRIIEAIAFLFDFISLLILTQRERKDNEPHLSILVRPIN